MVAPCAHVCVRGPVRKCGRGRPFNEIVRCHLSDAPVTVARFIHPVAAHIARMRLESEGVPVFVQSLNFASVDWLMSNALGGIALQVPPSAVERAREVLDLPDIVEPFEIPCPKCASTNVRRSTLWRTVVFLSVHFLTIPLPFSNRGLRCTDCGNAWELNSDT